MYVALKAVLGIAAVGLLSFGSIYGGWEGCLLTFATAMYILAEIVSGAIAKSY